MGSEKANRASRRARAWRSSCTDIGSAGSAAADISLVSDANCRIPKSEFINKIMTAQETMIAQETVGHPVGHPDSLAEGCPVSAGQAGLGWSKRSQFFQVYPRHHFSLSAPISSISSWWDEFLPGLEAVVPGWARIGLIETPLHQSPCDTAPEISQGNHKL